MSTDYTPAGGPRLSEFLDGLPVESRWLAGSHVVWSTGQQDRGDGIGPEDASHCSAFAAAAALALDLYVLRPPNHAQELLANAQAAWLASGDAPGPDAASSGWVSLGLSGDDGVLQQAVALASAGQLVLASYTQPPFTDPVTGVRHHPPGHIAILRPQLTDAEMEGGPAVISAGLQNFSRTSMETAFANHPGAWPAAIALFACPTPLQEDSPAGTI